MPDTATAAPERATHTPDLIDRIIEAEKRATGANKALLQDCYNAVRARDVLLAALRPFANVADDRGLQFDMMRGLRPAERAGFQDALAAVRAAIAETEARS